MASKTQTKTINGLKFKAKAHKRTLPFYKDVGAKINIKSSRSKTKKRNVEVYLQNRYYMNDEFTMGDSTQLVEFLGPVLGERKFLRKWSHKHFATGVGIKLKLDSIVPSTGVQGSMPLVGVISEIAVMVEHDGVIERDDFMVQVGAVPENIVFRMLTPRIGSTPPISIRNEIERRLNVTGQVSIQDVFEEHFVYHDKPFKRLRKGIFRLF
jgi:hypothetical protein